MSVTGVSNESIFKKNQTTRSSSGSEFYSSDEETRLISKEKNASNEKPGFPKQVFFIVGNEFCERFCYYGLRVVLTLFLVQRLFYSEDKATVFFHLFAMFAYFTPLIGAIIADSWLGKYRTILYISIIYCIGCIVLSAGAIPNTLSVMTAVSLTGLFIISCGTGGIKPCVSAFGGDQFKPGQELQLQKFFSFFYMSINLGSFIATFLTPILREDVHCFSEDSCYSLAFGVPAILMLLSLLLFIAGKPLYTINKPKENIIVKVFQCIWWALVAKFRRKTTDKNKEHWLDYAEDKFDKTLISDVRILLHILVLYLPLPVFWALFDQQGSRWTLQATKMNGKVGNFIIKPDQMQVFNPLLIVAFIPLFDYIVYPLFRKFNFLTKPLQRMSAGLLLSAVSFIIAGFIALQLEALDPFIPANGESELTVINNSPCTLRGINGDISLKQFESTVIRNIPERKTHSWTITADCSYQVASLPIAFNSTQPLESMIITVSDNKLQFLKTDNVKEKHDKGEARVRVFYSVDKLDGNISFKFQSDTEKKIVTPNTPSALYGTSSYFILMPESYRVFIGKGFTYSNSSVGEILLQSGGSYIVNIYQDSAHNEMGFFSVIPVEPNSVHLLLQIPQYLVITAGEIMFSITGLEFSYSQSPASMKSVLQASWLLTVAFGNLLVLIITELNMFAESSHELFFYGAMMALVTVVFSVMAYFYKYVKTESSKESFAGKNGKANDAYEEETDFNK